VKALAAELLLRATWPRAAPPQLMQLPAGHALASRLSQGPMSGRCAPFPVLMPVPHCLEDTASGSAEASLKGSLLARAGRLSRVRRQRKGLN